jgi:hypothetical protein
MALKERNTPKNMTELRDALLVIFHDINTGVIEDMGRAKELSNAAGKIIKSAAVQVEYAGLRKEIPEIPFLK